MTEMEAETMTEPDVETETGTGGGSRRGGVVSRDVRIEPRISHARSMECPCLDGEG